MIIIINNNIIIISSGNNNMIIIIVLFGLMMKLRLEVTCPCFPLSKGWNQDLVPERLTAVSPKPCAFLLTRDCPILEYQTSLLTG